jgi:hypothetical protein
MWAELGANHVVVDLNSASTLEYSVINNISLALLSTCLARSPCALVPGCHPLDPGLLHQGTSVDAETLSRERACLDSQMGIDQYCIIAEEPLQT